MRRVRLAAVVLAVVLVAAAPARASFTPRIVGGSSTSIDALPFQVALVDSSSTPSIGQFCGGSIRDETHVITAAHCVVQGGVVSAPGDIDVFAGASDLRDVNAQRVHVQGVSFMPSYDDTTSDDDAALLTLAQPLNVASTKIEPIPLIDDSQASFWEPGDLATVSGWGNTSANGNPSYPNDLHSVQVPIVSDTDCNNAYSHDGGIIGADMVCAGDLQNGGEDSCQGDSGGPLAVPTGTPSTPDYRLIGIVSFGIGCADKRYPGVYTEVASPDIRTYLTATPPPPPVDNTPPSVTGTLKEGQTLTCDPGTWSGSPTFHYQFGRLDSLSDTTPDAVTGVQATDTYTEVAADGGKYIVCAVQATNAGGTVVAKSAPVGPVEALPQQPSTQPTTPTTPDPTAGAAANPGAQVLPLPQFDTTKPVSRLYRAACGNTSCKLNIAVVDAGYSLGLQTLEGTVRSRYRANCRRHGRIVRCTRIRKSTLAIRAIAGGHFIATAGGLPHGTDTFSFVAIDAAGNRQSPALSFRRHTPPLKKR